MFALPIFAHTALVKTRLELRHPIEDTMDHHSSIPESGDQLRRRVPATTVPTSTNHCSKGIVTAEIGETEEHFVNRVYGIDDNLTTAGWNAVTFTDLTKRKRTFKAVKDRHDQLHSGGPLSEEQRILGLSELITLAMACQRGQASQEMTRIGPTMFGVRAIKNLHDSTREALDIEFASHIPDMIDGPEGWAQRGVWKGVEELCHETFASVPFVERAMGDAPSV